MPGKKLDRVGAQSALETVRESPVITFIALSPAIIVFALVWFLAGFGWALLLLIVLGAVGVVGAKYLR